MKLGGLTFMLNIIASSIMLSEGLENTHYKQRKKSFRTQFLQFAMLFILGFIRVFSLC